MRSRYRSPPPPPPRHRRSPHPTFRHHHHHGPPRLSSHHYNHNDDYPHHHPHGHALDIETESLTSSTSDPFDHETDSTIFPHHRRHRHHPHHISSHGPPPPPPPPPAHEPFTHLPINIPSTYPNPPHPHDILLLSPLLTRLHISLSTPYAPKAIHHIAPTYDLRVRDAIKPVLPLAAPMPLSPSPHLVKSYIKVRNDWWEVDAGSSVRVSDILRLGGMVVNGKGEVEVKVVVSEEVEKRAVKGWERETRKTKTERMRVFDM